MKCHKLFQGLCLAIIFANSYQEELCGLINGRAIYLQLGEQGTITHSNITRNYAYHCSVELITCPSCSIEIKVNSINIPNICPEYKKVNETSNDCLCGSVNIWEPSSLPKTRRFCTMPPTPYFKSTTRTVSISFDFVGRNWTGDFSISYAVQRNQNIIKGSIGTVGVFTSPHFPSFYPRDFGMEHVLSCEDNNCTIGVIFKDFLISPSSIIEFYDWDGKPMQLYSGIIARPQQIFSTGPMLTVRFYGNGGTSLGYKAQYEFFNNTDDTITKSNLECGGEVDSIGGSIYMKDAVGLYDCVWTIQPFPSISHFKTHIYLRVLNFTTDGVLTIHSGTTSDGRIVEISTNSNNESTEHVVSISTGFYITFSGELHKNSTILMAYSAFSYVDCLPGADWFCENKRCISNTLMCDSVDNCGDNSDEIIKCRGEVKDIPIQYWWPLRNNNNQGGSVAGGALMALGAALIGAAMILAVALCRVALRVRPPNSHMQLHNDHARTIAHLLSLGEIEERDEPPLYEPPPEYNQVVKPMRPRRKKSSAQRLLQQSPIQDSIQHGELPTSSLDIKSKQEPTTTMQHVKDIFNGTIIRKHLSENSPPLSLETTGYDEDLGLSLTLSTSSTKGNTKFQNREWTSSTANKVSFYETPSNASAVSFDTLRSSHEKILNIIPPLFKCHSQDNMLLSRSRPTSITQSTSCRNFHIRSESQNPFHVTNNDQVNVEIDSTGNIVSKSKENISL